MRHLKPFELFEDEWVGGVVPDNLLQKPELKQEDLVNVDFFHGTIKERWSKDFMDYLFVTTDREFAKNQALDWDVNGNKFTPMVVKIKGSQIVKYKWETDDDDGRYPYKTWQESLKEIGCFVVIGNLPIDEFPIVWQK